MLVNKSFQKPEVGLYHTESLERVSHGLVLDHVDQPSAQTEVREDQQHVLQDVVYSSDLLQTVQNIGRGSKGWSWD